MFVLCLCVPPSPSSTLTYPLMPYTTLFRTNVTRYAPEPSPILTSGRLQLGQALTNIVKNGVEAIQQKREEGGTGERDRITMRISETNGQVGIEISDTGVGLRSEEHTSELQSLMRISYAVFCLKKNKYQHQKILPSDTKVKL